MSSSGAFSRRLTRVHAAVAFAFFAITFLILRLSPSLTTYNDYKSNALHIAVFATSSNYHLCQLHLSAALLGYPAPTLLNYGDQEDQDEMKQHLAKIEGALSFLDSFSASQQNDLVFILDGFDVWFQLPQSYIVKRYYDVVLQADKRHVATFGESLVAKHRIRNTVVFGPDKSCAPAGRDHTSCWAIPESWMPPLSFGPDTDHGRAMHNRPRWLNSGTIIGPVRDLRAVFKRALELSQTEHVTDSDQFYFSTVFGEQSYARRLLKFESDRARGADVAGDEQFLHPKYDDNTRTVPDIKDQRTEYNIGLDWSSSIFQTAGFYADYLTWIRHNSTSKYVQEGAKKGNYYHHFTLPEDLAGHGALPEDNTINEALSSWNTLPLATNTASRTVPPVLHINGKKGYRHLWWPRSWFFPYIEPMLRELKENKVGSVGKEIHAIMGAWTFNKGEKGWVDWNDTCAEHEDQLMGRT